ncbi:MAG: TlpA disulfide reductase family protein [Planctomycetota bacterium]
MLRASILFSAVLAAGCTAGQGIVKEGSGERRDALDAMVYQPAPLATILDADDWIGDAPTLADISGKPVVVFTWAEWYRPSQQVAMLANRLQAEFDDLVVIGVHDAEGWEEAPAFVERRRLTFPTVHDADGSIRELLKVDQDPDVYVIDRAGQFRHTDIATESLRAAVEEVAGESRGDASGIEQRLADRDAEADRAIRRSRAINDGVRFERRLNIPFVKPAAEEYTAAAWPVKKQNENDRRNRRRGETGPVSIAIPTEGYFGGEAPNTEGRVVVMYTWHPASRYTLTEVMPLMESVQLEYSRDVTVIGALGPFAENTRRRSNEEPPAIQRLPSNVETIEQYVGDRRYTHSLVALSGSPLPALEGSRRNENATFGTIGVISTDGVLRRYELYTEWEDLRRALDTVLRVDPGVKARRAAEDAFIRGGG